MKSGKRIREKSLSFKWESTFPLLNPCSALYFPFGDKWG